jgi:hypothetical protein
MAADKRNGKGLLAFLSDTSKVDTIGRAKAGTVASLTPDEIKIVERECRTVVEAYASTFSGEKYIPRTVIADATLEVLKRGTSVNGSPIAYANGKLRDGKGFLFLSANLSAARTHLNGLNKREPADVQNHNMKHPDDLWTVRAEVPGFIERTYNAGNKSKRGEDGITLTGTKQA